tara:strand:- start:2742 stop:3173 length:432 start_codon:yes stop_codon:yes gene_type:complete
MRRQICRLSIFLVFITNFLSLSVLGEENETNQLAINKDSIVSFSNNSISFQAKASNFSEYKVGLSCFSAEQTSSGKEHGEIRVLKSEHHVGASCSFSYSDCLSMKKEMELGNIKVFLSWDQKGFDDFVSTTLDYDVVSERSED